MEQSEVKAMVEAWINGNRLAQQQKDWSCYDIARFFGYKPNTLHWDAAVQGAAQYKFNGTEI